MDLSDHLDGMDPTTVLTLLADAREFDLRATLTAIRDGQNSTSEDDLLVLDMLASTQSKGPEFAAGVILEVMDDDLTDD